MNDFFTMHQGDPHNVFFAARMGLVALGLSLLFALTIIATLVILEWREETRKHKRYLAERDERREQHVRNLLANQRDKLLHSAESCVQTMPDMFGDARIVEEAFREFR
jgi:hypothetical protein